MSSREQVRENMRNTAKTAAKRSEAASATFPEIPRGLPPIPQRYSSKPAEEPPVGALTPEPDAAGILTKDARRAIVGALQRRRPKPSPQTLEAVLEDLKKPLTYAAYAFSEPPPQDFALMDERLEQVQRVAYRLVLVLNRLQPMESQIGLGDVMRYRTKGRSLRELMTDLVTLKEAARDIRPGPRKTGRPKAGTVRTRYLGNQAAAVLRKHGFQPNATVGGIFEDVVRALWPCVEPTPAPSSLTRFLRLVLAPSAS